MGAGSPASGKSVAFRELIDFDDGGTKRMIAVGQIAPRLGNLILAPNATPHGVAAWNGLAWSTLVGSSGRYVSEGSAGTLHHNGSSTDLYVAGLIADGQAEIKGIARWDGSDWTVIVTLGTHDVVRAMASYAGDLFFGGVLYDAIEQRHFLGRWSAGTAFDRDYFPASEGTLFIVNDLIGFTSNGTERVWCAVSRDSTNGTSRVYRLDLVAGRPFVEEIVDDESASDTRTLEVDTTTDPASLVVGGDATTKGAVLRRVPPNGQGAGAWERAAPSNWLTGSGVWALKLLPVGGGLRLVAGGVNMVIADDEDESFIGPGLVSLDPQGRWEVSLGQPSYNGEDTEDALVTALCVYTDDCGDAYVMVGGEYFGVYLAGEDRSIECSKIAGFGPDKGDFNCDFSIDFFDYNDFLLCFEEAVCPGGVTADFNCDGFADFLDLDMFLFWFAPPE
ncbi:MAG: hypothetical protein HRU70_05890 [Phycisphaeraceae bacterium]|nr:MAG: hypothetical protein HRU70_05890 [Phycisphaeraceae bacterium]